MKLKFIIAQVIIYVFVLYMINWVCIGYHENAHAQVFSFFNCEEQYIEVDYNIYAQSAETKCLNYTKVPQNYDIKQRELHAWTEIIGYHTFAVLNAIMLLGLFFYIIIISKNDDGRFQD